MNSQVEELHQLERQCRDLEEQLGKLKQTNGSVDESTVDAELASLQLENTKLKFRADILQRSIKEEMELQNKLEQGVKPKSEEKLSSIIGELRQLFLIAIRRSFPNLENAPLVVTKSDKADYQCNSALPLVKILNDKSIKPADIAKKIISNLPPNDLIGQTVVAGPGFINITLNNEEICNRIRNLVIHGVKIDVDISPNERIIIDYSSANIAKEMHVGHLRSTIIGDSISRLMEYLGYDVLRLNHVGDWGTQFGMLLAHLIEKFPHFLTSPPPIGDLQTFYKEAKKRFDEDAQFKKRAYDCVVKLQAKEHDALIAWSQICDTSRKEFEAIFKMLGISPKLIERGESFYQDLMVEIVKELESKGLLEEDEGRKVMFPTEKIAPLTVVKSDGGFTYDTSDMAALKHRVQVEKGTRIIYVIDDGQKQHMQTIFSCGAKAGIYDPKKVRLDFAGFGVVLGEDRKKFKTRSGDSIRLKNLFEEGLERSLAKLVEKGRDKVLTPEELKLAQEAVAFGCIKYADLSHDRNHEYVFSFDRMLDDKGNTAVYLLYALTRIRSIIRKAQLETPIEQLALQTKKLDLTHAREIKLTRFILKFPEVILQIADDLYLHTLCSFLYDLSVVFSEFYDQCYCIEKLTVDDKEVTKVNVDRIILCEATAKVIEQGLLLLGIKTVEKM